jgi:hypothetical protein
MPKGRTQAVPGVRLRIGVLYLLAELNGGGEVVCGLRG